MARIILRQMLIGDSLNKASISCWQLTICYLEEANISDFQPLLDYAMPVPAISRKMKTRQLVLLDAEC